MNTENTTAEEMTTAQKCEALLASLNVSMTFRVLDARTDKPKTQTKEDKEWSARAAHFAVRVMRRDMVVMDFEYSMGAAHFARCVTVDGRHELTTKTPFNRIARPLVNVRNGEGPTLADVFCSLLSDADCGDRTFEDFCSDFGYDTDSRRAENTWRACVDTSIRLRTYFDPADVAKLREAFQDY